MTDQTNPVVEAVGDAIFSAMFGRAKMGDKKTRIQIQKIARAAHIAGIKALMENVTPEMIDAYSALYPLAEIPAGQIVHDFRVVLTAHMEQMK